MRPVRLAVLAAIACTMWFNGSYAWSRGSELPHQISMVALALTIDLCKATFLPVAVSLWHQRLPMPALVLLTLWPFALGYSTFAGYAYVSTHRSDVARDARNTQDIYDRHKSTRDALSVDIATMRGSSAWDDTAACSAPRTERQRKFCAAATEAISKLDAADQALAVTPQAAADPEITILSHALAVTPEVATFVVALLPALLIELIASLGPYAIFQRRPLQQPHKSSDAPSAITLHRDAQNTSYGAPAQSEAGSPPVSPQTTKASWSIPARREA